MNRFILIISIFLVSCAQIVHEKPDVKKIPHWSKLTLREKVAQMIMVRIRGDFYNNEHWYKKSLKQWLTDDGIGGVISFGGSIHGTYHNINMFQKWAKYPLLVAADYERGLGQWMSGATLFPSNMAVAATGNSNYAYEQGKITANEAKAIGVHITLAPVMDVNNNPNNPIINFRAYSDDANTVSEFGNAFIKGAQEGGIFACSKHYPGHGNTSTDSHTSLPTINGSKEELEKVELLPFKSSIDNGVKMVMVGHIAMPGLDSSGEPASYSHKITTKILREEWGFNGIIITDGMEMGGLTESTWAGESAVRAVLAGADILLLPMDVKQSIDAVVSAVENGRISEERINESVKKIWEAKHKLNVFNTPQENWVNVESKVGISAHTKVAREIAEKSITVVKNSNNILPLRPEKIGSLTHIILSTDEGVRDMLKSFLWDVNRTHSNVDEVFVIQPASDLRIKEILQHANSSDKVLVSMLVRIRMDKGISTIDSTHAKVLEALNDHNIPFTAFSFGSPYLPDYSYLDSYVCVYGYGKVSQKAAANILWGRKPATGVLPVDLNKKYKRGMSNTTNTVVPLKLENRDYNLNPAWAILDSAIENKIFPGAQIFISKQGAVVASKGFGHQTYDNNSPPITDESIYDVASLTKVLTTTPIVMKLISQKKMGLEQTVAQFYDFPINPQFNKVTISHLLTHSSGLIPFIEFFKQNPLPTKDEIINQILQSELNFEPSTDYAYSDLGMILLYDIIEKISNRKFDLLAKSWIYNPLSMTQTQFNPRNTDHIVPTEYDGFVRNSLVKGTVHDENAFIMGGVSGHAGLFSTAKDIGNYSQLFLNGGIWKGTRYFRHELVDKFTKRFHLPENSERTLGWDTPSQNGKSSAGDYFSKSSFGHLGFTGTSLWIDPENEISVVLLTNRVHPSRERGGIYGIRREFHNSVMKILLNEEV